MSSFAILSASITYLLYRKDFFIALILGALVTTTIGFIPSFIIEHLLRGCFLVAWMLWIAIIVAQELKKDNFLTLSEGFWRMTTALGRAWWFLVISAIITFCMTVTLYMPTPDHENIGVIVTFISLLIRGLQSFFNTALLPMIALGSYSFYVTMPRALSFVHRNFFLIAALLLIFLGVILVVYAVTGLINLVIAMAFDKLLASCFLKSALNSFIFQWGLFLVYALLAIAQVHFYLAFNKE